MSFRDARIIFLDTEESNWAWDEKSEAILLASLLFFPTRLELR